MTRSYLNHPSEEALERFLLHHAQEDELEGVETHILACNACVARLEEIELQIAATKLVLKELSGQPQAAQAATTSPRRTWFSVPALSWAGAVAVVALAIGLTPRMMHTSPAVDIALSANRGLNTPSVPEDAPLHLHLAALDVANGPVDVSVVDGYGSEVWKGMAKAENERITITVPKLDKPGAHFLRLYSVNRDKTPGELLREFSFQVK